MKKITFAPKPQGASAPTADEWVANRLATPSEPTKRLTLDIPLSLHRRVKLRCAMEDLVMADVIRELLAERFPEMEPADAL